MSGRNYGGYGAEGLGEGGIVGEEDWGYEGSGMDVSFGSGIVNG